MEQLRAATLLPFLRHLSLGQHTVSARADPHIVVVLRARKEEFKEGVLYALHRDVGQHLTDFRGFRGQFGKGSLQIVLDTRSWQFYADVDKWNPYADVVGFVGHASEVVGGWVKSWFS